MRRYLPALPALLAAAVGAVLGDVLSYLTMGAGLSFIALALQKMDDTLHKFLVVLFPGLFLFLLGATLGNVKPVVLNAMTIALVLSFLVKGLTEEI